MSVNWSQDSIDFTFIDGWVIKAHPDQENKVLHITVSNNNGDIADSVGNSWKEQKFCCALIEEAKDEEV